MVRRKARRAALQMLCAQDLGQESIQAVVQNHWGSLAVSDEGREFADMLVLGWYDRREEIESILQRFALHWRIERMPLVDRNLLRLAIYELHGCDEIPRSVTINEAVELAKEFCDADAPSFVNGVLDRVARSLGKL